MEEELMQAKSNIESLVKVARNIKSQVLPELHGYLDVIIEEVAVSCEVPSVATLRST